MIGSRLVRGVAGTAADAVGRTALAGLDALLAWRYTDEAIQRVLASRVTDHAVVQVTDVVTERQVIEHVLDRLLAEGIDRQLVDTIVERMLESEELWLVVEEIVRSPAVTQAIGQTSAGLADQVAGQVRARSLHADERLERVARRLLRRRSGVSGSAVPKTP